MKTVNPYRAFRCAMRSSNILQPFCLLITTGVFTLHTGCASLSPQAHRRPTIIDSDNEVMRTRALAVVPVGTSLADAKRIMEGEGFRCREYVDTESGDPALNCGFSERAGIFVTWGWGVTFICPDGLVADARCSQGGTGP